MGAQTRDVLEWIATHLQVIGWPVVVGLVWKGRGLLDRFITSWEMSSKKIETTEAIAATIKANVDSLASNHFEHLAKDLSALKELQEKSVVLLAAIDKGIAVLGERLDHI